MDALLAPLGPVTAAGAAMDGLDLAAFALAVVVLALKPGPDLLLIVSRGISQGRGPALLTALGFFLAGAVQVPLLAVGLTTLVEHNPLLFDGLRWAGGLYLIGRGCRLLVTAGETVAADAASRGAAGYLRDGVVAGLLNPSGHAFMLAFLPQFVRPDAGHVAAQVVLLGLTMRLVALAVEALAAVGAGAMGGRLRHDGPVRRWVHRGAGCVLLLIGARLVLAPRPG